jgi:HK97 family phage major capsid protein
MSKRYHGVPEGSVHEGYKHSRELERERMRTNMISIMGATTGLRDIADECIIRGHTIAKADELMRMAQREPPRKALGEIGLTKREAERFSILRWAQALVRDGPGGTNDLFETEASRQVCKATGRELDDDPGLLHIPREVLTLQRDLVTNVGSSGGYLAAGFKNISFSDALHAASVTMRLGAELISGLRTNAGIPRVSADATGYWIDEGGAPVDSAQTFEDLMFSPKTVAAQVTISHKLLKQSSPMVEGVVQRNLGQLLGSAVDIGAIAGDGTLGTPLGIINVPGIGAFTGASLDLAALVNAQVDVSTGNAVVNENSLAYATTPAVAALLKARQRFAGTAEGSDRALWEGKVARGIVEGCTAISSTVVPTATMVFGDWSQVVIGEWGVLTIDLNPFGATNFSRGDLALRAMWSIDVGVRHPVSFSVASSIT